MGTIRPTQLARSRKRGARQPQPVYIDGKPYLRATIAERSGWTVRRVSDRIERVRREGRKLGWADFA